MAKRRKPLIGVTGSQYRGRISWYCIKFSVWLAGGKGERVTPVHRAEAKAIEFDGIILAGGEDIDPSLYGQMNVASYDCNPERDRLEYRLVKEAYAAKLPLLGICRGAQMINVVRGGTLYQQAHEIYKDFIPTDSLLGKIIVREAIFVTAKDSFLFRLWGDKTKHYVNSIHRQALHTLGQGLASVATDTHRMIQAIQDKDTKQSVLGVQWHPEYMLLAKKQRKLFQWFIKEITQVK